MIKNLSDLDPIRGRWKFEKKLLHNLGFATDGFRPIFFPFVSGKVPWPQNFIEVMLEVPFVPPFEKTALMDPISTVFIWGAQEKRRGTVKDS